VNSVPLPILSVVGQFNRSLGWAEAMPNAHALLQAAWFINLGLLILNMLPIYPLDGGQILRSLLWYVVGRAQLDGGHGDRLRRRGGAHLPRRVDAIRLVWRTLCVHPHKLLGRTAASPSFVASSQIAGS
jgi:Zn-dependent protease